MAIQRPENPAFLNKPPSYHSYNSSKSFHFKKNSIISSPISTSPNGSSELLDIGSTIATTSLPTLWRSCKDTSFTKKKGIDSSLCIFPTSSPVPRFQLKKNKATKLWYNQSSFKAEFLPKNLRRVKKSQAWKLPHSHPPNSFWPSPNFSTGKISPNLAPRFLRLKLQVEASTTRG